MTPQPSASPPTAWRDVTPPDQTPHPYWMRFWQCAVCGNGFSSPTPPTHECVFVGTAHPERKVEGEAKAA